MKSQANFATKPLLKGVHYRSHSQKLATEKHLESVLKGIPFNYMKIRLPDCRPQTKHEPLDA